MVGSCEWAQQKICLRWGLVRGYIDLFCPKCYHQQVRRENDCWTKKLVGECWVHLPWARRCLGDFRVDVELVFANLLELANWIAISAGCSSSRVVYSTRAKLPPSHNRCCALSRPISSSWAWRDTKSSTAYNSQRSTTRPIKETVFGWCCLCFSFVLDESSIHCAFWVSYVHILMYHR